MTDVPGTVVGLYRAAIDLAESAPLVELFVAMTLLPLVGVPVSPFWVAMGIRVDLASATALSGLSLLLNEAIGYWLAHRGLRVPLSRWMARRAHDIPRPEGLAELQFIVLVRVAPALPLFVQNYALGLAGVRFGSYMLVSVPVQAAYALAFAWFGYSLTEQDFWDGVVGGSLVVTTLLGMSLVRRLLQARFRRGPA